MVDYRQHHGIDAPVRRRSPDSPAWRQLCNRHPWSGAGTRMTKGGRTLHIDSAILVGHRLLWRASQRESPCFPGVCPSAIPPGISVPGSTFSTREWHRRWPIGNWTTRSPNPIFEMTYDPFGSTPSPSSPPGRWGPMPGSGRSAASKRSGSRGVGTRNYIVILAANSQVSSFVRLLDRKLKPELGPYKNVTGVVAVSHTEGGADLEPTIASWSCGPWPVSSSTPMLGRF